MVAALFASVWSRRRAQAAYEARVREALARAANGTAEFAALAATAFRVKTDETVFYCARCAESGRVIDSPGVLTITNKRVHFNHDDPARADWSKTWASIVGWGKGPNELRLDLSSGTPKTLVFPPAPKRSPLHDPRVVELLLERARAQ